MARPIILSAVYYVYLLTKDIVLVLILFPLSVTVLATFDVILTQDKVIVEEGASSEKITPTRLAYEEARGVFS